MEEFADDLLAQAARIQQLTKGSFNAVAIAGTYIGDELVLQVSNLLRGFHHRGFLRS